MNLPRKSFVVMAAVVLTMVAASVVSAGPPHTFAAGTPAKAEEVNENISFVNFGNVIVKSNGVEIGSMIGIDHSEVYVLTPEGYFVAVNPEGNVYKVWMYFEYYETNDCTGTAYVASDVLLPRQITKCGDGTLRYVSKSALPVTIAAQSKRDGSGSCVPLSQSMTAYPLTPNDPAVTGVNQPYTPPITIERR